MGKLMGYSIYYMAFRSDALQFINDTIAGKNIIRVAKPTPPIWASTSLPYSVLVVSQPNNAYRWKIRL
jgi:hypothetical protein